MKLTIQTELLPRLSSFWDYQLLKLFLKLATGPRGVVEFELLLLFALTWICSNWLRSA